MLFDYLGAWQFGARSRLERRDVIGFVDLDFLFNGLIAVPDALTSEVYVLGVVCRVHAHQRLLSQFRGANETGAARDSINTGSYVSGCASRGPWPYCFRAGPGKLDSLTSAQYSLPRRHDRLDLFQDFVDEPGRHNDSQFIAEEDIVSAGTVDRAQRSTDRV